MNGATVVKDVTDWVRAYEFDGASFTGIAPDWFPVQPGSGTFYTQRVSGAARHTATVQLVTGYLG
jgi:outer membrane usher protein FimD/PapC